MCDKRKVNINMKQVQITITKRLLNKLDKLSTKKQISRSEIIRRITDQYFEEENE